MAKERIAIPDELAAEVLFSSDRTCCVCRIEKHKVQIHHIDGDAANNRVNNLAVICLHCHSDAHTNGAFVRNLTPELIRLYNVSWREIVKLRLLPTSGVAADRELAAEAYLEASLDCHAWKLRFAQLDAKWTIPTRGKYTDVWDMMAAEWTPEYSDSAYQRHRKLLDDGTRALIARFDRLIHLFQGVLSAEFCAQLVRAQRQLDAERQVYLHIPALIAKESLPPSNVNVLFKGRFTESIRVIKHIAQEADAKRSALLTK